MMVMMGWGVPLRVSPHLISHTCVSLATFRSHDQTSQCRNGFLFYFCLFLASSLVLLPCGCAFWVREYIPHTVMSRLVGQQLEMPRAPSFHATEVVASQAFIDNAAFTAVTGDCCVSGNRWELSVLGPGLSPSCLPFLSILCSHSSHKYLMSSFPFTLT